MANQAALPPSDMEQRLARIEQTLTKLAASTSSTTAK
jgi:hypothetical protein